MTDQEQMMLMGAGIRGYRAEPKKPAILTDDELRAIPVPVLLVTGARSALITPAQARDRGASCRTRRSPSSARGLSVSGI